MALAQKIMDRLLDLSAQLNTYDPDAWNALVGGVSGAGGSGGYLSRSIQAAAVDNSSINTRLRAESSGSSKVHRKGSVGSVTDALGGGAAGGGALTVARREGTTAVKGMETNVTELGDLIMRCLKSLRQKVKR